MKRFLVIFIFAYALGLLMFGGEGLAGERESISPERVNEALMHEIRGNELDDTGQLDEAIKEYEKSMKINPYSSSALFNLGFAYLRAGKNEEAIYSYRKAIELNPEDAELYKLLGIAYVKEGFKKDAVKIWEKSLSLNPDQPKVKEFIQMNGG